MQPTERLVELAAEVARRNPDICHGRQAYEVEVLPWAIVIRLRPAPALITDPDPRPSAAPPGRPINYVQTGNPWHRNSDPWQRGRNNHENGR